MKSRTIHLLLLVVFLSILAGLWLIWIPAQEEQSLDQASRAQEESLRVSKNEKSIIDLQNILNRYKKNQTAIKSFSAFLARDPYESLRLISGNIEKLARKHNLDLTRVLYQKAATSKSGLTSFEINLPLAGSYRDFRQFLLDLEKEEQFLAIHEISVDGDAETGLLSIELGMMSYFHEEAVRD